MDLPLISTLLTLALVASGAALGVAIWVARTCARLNSHQQVRIKALEQQLAVVVKGAVGVGQRILAVEKKLQSLDADRDDLQGASDGYAYTQAMRMFDQGADVEAVVSCCGLSSSEASLMALVRAHQNPSAKKSSRARVAEMQD